MKFLLVNGTVINLKWVQTIHTREEEEGEISTIVISMVQDRNWYVKFKGHEKRDMVFKGLLNFLDNPSKQGLILNNETTGPNTSE